MANTIEIKDGKLSAKIAPNNGGMVVQLTLGGTDVLMFNEGALDLTPMSAGGSPVMFPFPSKTKGDTYVLDGREYAMPMHGLVKNATFALKSKAADAVTLWYDGSASQKEANYPFDYVLEIEYKIAGNSLLTTARVKNNSDKPLPHYLGWHPYFKATDKAALKFEHSMTSHYNYIDCVDEPTIIELDLSKRWDDVFHTPEKRELTLYNKPDGYKARYILDEAHNVVVVCSWIEGAVCLEPWCGLPNSINNGRFVKYVAPGKTERYSVELEIEKL